MKVKQIRAEIAKTVEKIIRQYLATDVAENDDECSDIEDGTGDIRFESDLSVAGYNIYGLTIGEFGVAIKVDNSKDEWEDDLAIVKFEDIDDNKLIRVCVRLIEHFSQATIEEIAFEYETYRHAKNYLAFIDSIDARWDAQY